MSPAPPSSRPAGTSTAPASGATSTAKLHTLAKAAGKLYFGTATDNPELTDTAYTAILENPHMFGQLTPANAMKWEDTEPEQGVWTFTEGDQIANLAKTNGMLLRGMFSFPAQAYASDSEPNVDEYSVERSQLCLVQSAS